MPEIHVGTSGWTYDDWAGRFYPEDVKGPDRLSYYASRFDTVEVNASFYRFPTQNMIKAWNRRLGEEFHLVVKGHRRITHQAKLANCESSVSGFMERIAQLERLKMVLWQLPPSSSRDDERLEAFLELVRKTSAELGLDPGSVRHAVEFRDESWWCDDVVEILAAHEACFVAVSHPELPKEVRPSTDLLYLRFHGEGGQLYDYDYSDEELRAWVERLRPHLEGRALYAFFNNDWQANAPHNAGTFRDLLASRVGS
jgi:uncharacterized protein YecE (DUF72 family)